MSTLDTASPDSVRPAEKPVTAPPRGYAPEFGSHRPDWNPLTRVGFRMAFIYFILISYLFGNGTIFYSFSAGNEFNYLLTVPMNHLAIWAGHHIFHLAHVPPNWNVNERGDDMINWVLNRLFFMVAVLGGLLWTAIAELRSNRRTEYRTLQGWLRFFLRLSVGFYMIGYGVIKVFPLQMPPLSLAVLNRPAGQLSGNILLYSLIGIHPLYECICGLLETLGGTLVLFRRTALAGTVFCIFVMSNVVLYNFFFDVTVKLFAVNLLLMEIFLVLPDVRPMFAFFWRHERVAPAGTWIPYDTRWGTRFYVRTLEVVFITASLAIIPLINGIIWQHGRAMARIHSPLLGGWRVDPPHPVTGPFIARTHPVTELYIDTVNRAFMLSNDDRIWRNFVSLDEKADTIFLNPYYQNGVAYYWKMPDANHLTLTPVPPTDTSPGAAAKAKRASDDKAATRKPMPSWIGGPVSLTRIPLPAHYPLLDPAFHVPIYGPRRK